LPVTHAVCSSDGHWIYTASKDGSIIKWNLNTCRKAAMVSKIRPKKSGNNKKGKKRQYPINEEVEGHTDEILAIALSDDGRCLASGGRDRMVVVWDVQGDGIKWVKRFRGHRDVISVLLCKIFHFGESIDKGPSHLLFARTAINSILHLMTGLSSYLTSLRLLWVMWRLYSDIKTV
jgi:WD40 repeat protein